MEYRPTIGLEVHAELKTRTKMFCDSKNDPDETRPNVNVCPICMAHPGTLPVINREAVKHVLRLGTAVGGKLADFTEFDRKSYFYPDIPKGYQISQYIHPLVTGGFLAGVDITRVHLEEDTARSIHLSTSLKAGSHGKSLIDFNRAGIPLMELVTEPVIRDAETAGRFARELQLLLRTLDASEANLEKGEMRIEANVSIAKVPETLASADTRRLNADNAEGILLRNSASSLRQSAISTLGTKVEIKNLNSFRSVERAIAFEIQRQTALIEDGEKVVQETRGWDEAKQETFHQRFKEGSADYRYFPEPDLPKLFISEIPEFSREALQASMPELPRERYARYAELGLKANDVVFISASNERGEFFDAVVSGLGGQREFIALAANYFISDLAGNPGEITPASFAKLIRMLNSQSLSSRGAKDTLLIMVEKGGDPETIAKEQGLIQVHDSAILTAAVDSVLAREEKAVREYKNGKEAALQYLIGKAMKESGGAGNPESLRKIIVDKLK